MIVISGATSMIGTVLIEVAVEHGTDIANNTTAIGRNGNGS
jgi:hypothetical protein